MKQKWSCHHESPIQVSPGAQTMQSNRKLKLRRTEQPSDNKGSRTEKAWHQIPQCHQLCHLLFQNILLFLTILLPGDPFSSHVKFIVCIFFFIGSIHVNLDQCYSKHFMQTFSCLTSSSDQPFHAFLIIFAPCYYFRFFPYAPSFLQSLAIYHPEHVTCESYPFDFLKVFFKCPWVTIVQKYR